MLVVEDTHTSYRDGFGPRKYSFINYVNHLINTANYRFSSLNPVKSNKRIYSIQSFESIVAFHVDTKKATLPSQITSNNGIDTSPKSYEHHENSFAGIISTISLWASNLKRFRILKLVGKKFTSIIYNKTGGTDKLKYYFSRQRQ